MKEKFDEPVFFIPVSFSPDDETKRRAKEISNAARQEIKAQGQAQTTVTVPVGERDEKKRP